MAVTLVVGTNTYATLAELLSFLRERYYSDLLGVVSSTTKTEPDGTTIDLSDMLSKLLVIAYDALSLLNYNDSPISDTVATAWIKDAQCLEVVALYFIYSDEEYLIRRSLQLQNVEKFIFDKQREEYSSKSKQIAGLYSKEAFKTISPHLVRYPTRIRINA